MKSLKLLALTFLITTNAYSGYYDGTYEYVHYHEICSGIMEVSTFNDTAHVTLNTVCGEFARTCDFEESMNFHGNTLIHSGDDFQFNIVFHGDASTLIFSRGNEMDFGYCGMNAYSMAYIEKNNFPPEESLSITLRLGNKQEEIWLKIIPMVHVCLQKH